MPKKGHTAVEGLDAIDRHILRTLQQNASLTTKELAATVSRSPSPVFERQRKLERNGFIRKYVAVVDPTKVGNGFMVFCNVRLKQHNKIYARQFVDAIANINEIVECYNTSGDFDFMLKIFVRDMAHYQDFVLNTLGTIDCVGTLHSIFVIGEVKNSHAVPIA